MTGIRPISMFPARTPRTARTARMLLAAALLAGCSSDDGSQPLTATTRAFITATPPAGGIAVSQGAVLGTIPLEAVDSIMVTIAGIAAIMPGDSVNYAHVLDLAGAGAGGVNL